MNRPPIPAEAEASLHPVFQFPKSLIHPLMVPWMWLVDKGLFGKKRLETHVVMTGFPRSGTTLAQLMVEACIGDLKAYGKERRALEIARFGSRASKFLLTKRPRDIFLIDEIREYYSEHSVNLKFILFIRDPRDVLTSYHIDKPNEYYVSTIRWKTIHEYWKIAIQRSDTVVVKYEEFVSNPAKTQQQLTDFIGWDVIHPFIEFHKHVPKGFDVGALNGVRKLDSQNSQRWRKQSYTDRICELLMDEELELTSRLIQLGYEPDASWAEEYLAGKIAKPRKAA